MRRPPPSRASGQRTASRPMGRCPATRCGFTLATTRSSSSSRSRSRARDRRPARPPRPPRPPYTELESSSDCNDREPDPHPLRRRAHRHRRTGPHGVGAVHPQPRPGQEPPRRRRQHHGPRARGRRSSRDGYTLLQDRGGHGVRLVHQQRIRLRQRATPTSAPCAKPCSIPSTATSPPPSRRDQHRDRDRPLATRSTNSATATSRSATPSPASTWPPRPAATARGTPSAVWPTARWSLTLSARPSLNSRGEEARHRDQRRHRGVRSLRRRRVHRNWLPRRVRARRRRSIRQGLRGRHRERRPLLRGQGTLPRPRGAAQERLRGLTRRAGRRQRRRGLITHGSGTRTPRSLDPQSRRGGTAGSQCRPGALGGRRRPGREGSVPVSGGATGSDPPRVAGPRVTSPRTCNSCNWYADRKGARRMDSPQIIGPEPYANGTAP